MVQICVIRDVERHREQHLCKLYGVERVWEVYFQMLCSAGRRWELHVDVVRGVERLSVSRLFVFVVGLCMCSRSYVSYVG